jgi:hypothetical protein
MRLKVLLLIAVIIMSTAACVCNRTDSTAPVKTIKSDYTGSVNTKAPGICTNYRQDFVFQYISEHIDRETKSVSELTIIPYYEKELFEDNLCFGVGYDAGMNKDSIIEWDFFEKMVAYFPSPVLRESPNDDYIYAVYESDKHTRVYVFFSQEKSQWFWVDGLTIIMKEKLSYDDFAQLNAGDSIDKVSAIDSIIPLYRKYYFDKLEDKSIVLPKEYRKDMFFSCHLLTDGILKITYDKKGNDKYVIKNILFREDFILPGADGDTCYRIQEGYYKE